MVILYILIIIAVVACFFLIDNKIQSRKLCKKDAQYYALEKDLGYLVDFLPTRQFVGPHRNFIFAVDYDNAKICLITRLGTSVAAFNTVKSVSIVKDNVIISEKHKSDIIKRTLIGGFLAGSEGALIGGLSAKSASQNKLTSLLVKIGLESITNPSLEIECFDVSLSIKGCLTNETESEKAEGQRIAETITVLIQDIIDTNGEKGRMLLEDADEEISRLLNSGRSFDAMSKYLDIYGLDKVGFDKMFKQKQG